MRNFVPRFILEKYAQGESAGRPASGGRFEAVSLFADLLGVSAATNALVQHGHSAAEAMADVMQALFTPLVEQVHAHGGLITSLTGDTLAALFPLADAYPHALAAAIAIQQHLVANPVQTTLYGSFPFTIKLGLGDGEVEWGILWPARDLGGPGEQRAVYFFGGPAMAAAAAAGRQANRGTLVLSPPVAQVLGKQVKTLPLRDGYVRVLGTAGALPPPPPPAAVLPPALEAAQAAFVPSSILDLGERGQFRQVVSVFVNRLGIASGVDLEVFVQEVCALQGQYGGHLARVEVGDSGGTLLLFWGVPVSYENDIPRALEFCLELGNHISGTFRAGLACGLLYAGLVGSAQRAEYTCYGDSVNLAAQLMQAAPWGSIWLDERLANRAQQRFVLSYVDHLACQGWAEKQPVYALLERRPPGEGFFAGQMVGRENELAELCAFVQPLFAPVGEQRFAGLLVLLGEAGLGKSRLAYEFVTGENWPVARSCQVFECQTDQLLRRPLDPFRYWLQRYFDQSPAQSEERNKRAFSRKLDQVIAAVPDAELGQELHRTRSCLGALVDLHWESSLYAQLDPQGRYENTQQALEALLKAESLRQPVVLLLEDVQWLDEDSQEFIRRLGPDAAPYPLAVLATARPEREGAFFGPGQPYRQVNLACLSPAELERLAADRLGGAVAPELVALLVERAESNPFFAEQILLYLREQGRLACREGTWGLVGRRDEVSLPDEVRTIFIARLDRLTEEIRAVVQAAAILGREFEVRVLAAMLQIEDEGGELPAELIGLVAAAEQEAIWSALTELRYLFKHTLLRDAAYEMQLQVHRRSLHRLAAEALERLYAADLPAHYGEIAYHYEAACRQGLDEVRVIACDYLYKAGERAAADYQNQSTVDYFSRALALTPAEAAEQRIRLLLERETVYHRLGRREEQRADLLALQELVQARQRPAEQAELALRQARLANAIDDYAAAVAAAAQAQAQAQMAGAVELEARAQGEWSMVLFLQGDLPGAHEHGQLALSLAQVSRRLDLQVDGLRILGNIAWGQGDYVAAHRYYEQSLALSREIGDRLGAGRALNNLGLIASNQGDYAAARRYYEQSLAIFRESGNRRGEGVPLSNLGNVACCQGDYATARQLIEQSLVISQEIGSRDDEGVSWHELGQAAFLQKDYDQAQACFQQALAIHRELSQPHLIAENLAGLSRVALARGDPAGARTHVLEMLPILEANPRLDGAEHPRRALLSCGQTLLALGDPRGLTILAAAHARLQEQAAQIEEEAARRMFLENIPENRELLAEFARLAAGQAQPAGGAPAQPPAPQKKEEGPAGLPDKAGRKKQKKAKKGKKGKKDRKKKDKNKGKKQDRVKSTNILTLT